MICRYREKVARCKARRSLRSLKKTLLSVETNFVTLQSHTFCLQNCENVKFLFKLLSLWCVLAALENACYMSHKHANVLNIILLIC